MQHTPDDITEYLATLDEVEVQAMEIAKSHLKTSFCLEKSSGFVAFLASKKKKATTTTTTK